MTKIFFKTADSITDAAFNMLIGDDFLPRQYGRIIVETGLITLYGKHGKKPCIQYVVKGYNTENFSIVPYIHGKEMKTIIVTRPNKR